MNSYIIKIIFLAAIFLHLSCLNCRLTECLGNGGFIQLRLVRNGQNALFGSSAFIEKDSVRSFVLTSFEFESPVEFLDTFQSISLYSEVGFPVILDINSIRTDTFSVTTKEISKSDCCTDYSITSISRNGMIICEG